MTISDIALIVMAVSVLGFAFSLLWLMKDIKVLALWSISLIATEIAVYVLGYEIKWYVLAILPFILFSVVYMLVKVKKRINAAIKRIEEREEKVKPVTQEEASHGN